MLDGFKNKPLLNKLLWFVLFAEVALIFYVNLTRSAINIDSDSAKLYVHALEMIENGTFFVPDWKYITTLELDCSLLLAVPLYGVLKDIYLSFTIANMVFLFLLIYSVYRALKCWDSEVYFLLAAILICIPYRMGSVSYMNMMFFNGSQYIVKVTLPIMLISLFSQQYNFKDKTVFHRIETAVFALIYLVLLFISSLSSGVYVSACGIFPVIAGCFIWRIYDRKKQRPEYFIVYAASIMAVIAGYGLNLVMEINSKGNSMVICKINEIRNNITLCIGGFFNVFDAYAEESVEVMSYAGINILFRNFFALGLIICALVAFRMLKEKKLDETAAMLLSVFIWNIFVLCICDTRYDSSSFSHRYHFIGLIPLMCVAVKLVFDYIKNHEKYVYVLGVTAIFVVVALMNCSSYRVVLNTAMDERYSQFCDFTRENQPKRMYFLKDNKPAEICRLIDADNEYFEVDEDGNIVVEDYYAEYDGIPADFTDSYLLYRKDLGEETELCGHTFVMCGYVGDKYVYALKG